MPQIKPPTESLKSVPAGFARAAGIARGLNIRPGMDDDGWTVPGPVRLSDGTTIRLLKDGEALRAWYDAISQAKESIFLESYIFSGDATGRAFMEQLARKAKDGLRVYLIYDSFGSCETPRNLLRELAVYGVNLQEFHPLSPLRCSYSWRPFNRDHRKLVVIDGYIAGLGGLNIADEYGGSWVAQSDSPLDTLWRDCGVGMQGPSVASFAQSFIRTWLYLRRGGRFARALYSHNLDGASGPVGVLASVPSMDSPMSKLLGTLLRSARKSIDLTSAYFAPSEYLVQELLAAVRRNVRVRLMLPSRTDTRIMLTAARSFYEQLMSRGVEIHERQAVRLHAKTLVIDDAVSLLGSTNFDHRSIDYNCEIAAVIRSEDFARQMASLFQHDIDHAQRIDPGQWRHRPMLDRFVQWCVNRSRYLL